MMASQPVLVIGATGDTGGYAVDALTALAGHCQLNGLWSCLGWELGPWRDYAAFWAHVSLVQILKPRARAAR